MFHRGDIVIFRPKEVIKDEFYPEYGDLNIGIVTDIEYDYVLEKNESNEQTQELLTLRIVGGFRPTVHYPDKLNTSINCATSSSFGWYRERREFLTTLINEEKNEEDTHVDFGRSFSSHITDLHVKFASLDTDESDIKDLFIRSVESSIHMHRPSIFHRKIEYALRSFKNNWSSCIFLKSFNRWKEFIELRSMRKVEASIIVQKYVRRYLSRDVLRIQRQWVKWWRVQKSFWCDYVDSSSESPCYNICGTQIYFSTKLAADRWSDQLKLCLNRVTFHALKSINRRLEHAMRKWKQSIMKQNTELHLMSREDLSASFL